MQVITNPKIESYLHSLAASYDEPVIQEMETYGRQNRFPIIDRLVGTMIHLLALSLNAKTVFELGSGYGYSAYWFSKAVGEQGRVVCTEGDPANRALAQDYLSKAGLWSRIDFRVGEAIGQIRQAQGQFDIVYNDIDKGDYPAAWLAAKDKIRPGGLYVCDNTLWFGRVVEDPVTDDIHPGWTEAIQEHNQLVYADKEFDATLIPLRDGVLVARRKT